MVTPLLKTKLYIPPIRSELVSRPRLIERLNEGTPGQNGAFARKLTLVSAPAGFGKTTLLSEWVQDAGCKMQDAKGKRQDGSGETVLSPASCVLHPPQVAWLSLNKDDNDPTRFWSYVIAALQTVYPSVGESALAALQSPQPLPIESVLTALINDIVEQATKTQPCVLILDDCHLIETRAIYDGLGFLLDHLPPQLHLVIATRSDPPLALSRLRGRGQLTEIRTSDLRFRPDEASAFLHQVTGLKLSPEDVAALEARTEGWIVGLQMVVLAMRGTLSMQGQGSEHISDFVAAFSGSHRYILDYLADEVLLQQPQDVQVFLLQTSVLDRLTGPLCDAVTAQTNTQEMIERLESANLFIVPLDDERGWYRYHHLFASLLRKRLQQTQPEQPSILHQRASRWYETRGLIAEAVRHALAADDADRAAQLVERNALAMMDHGELATLLGWLDALPGEVQRRRPWLCVAHAWALAYSGQLDAVEPLLRDAERGMDGLDKASTEALVLSKAKAPHTAGHIATIRAYAANLRGEYPHATEFARQATRLLPDDDLTTRAFAASQLAIALRTSDGLAAATQAAIEASAISRAAGDSHVAVMTLCDLAGLLALQGHLYEAADTYRDALQLIKEHAVRSGRQLPVAGFVYGRLSTLLYGRNELEAAARMAQKGVELCRRWGWTELFVDCCMYLAHALQAVGDEQGALDAIREAKRAASQLSPWYEALVERLEAMIRLSQGDVESAVRWAESQRGELRIGDEPGSKYVFRYLSMVHVLLAQARAQSGAGCERVDPAWDDELEKALQSLTGLLQKAEEHEQIARAAEIQISQAAILQALGRVEEALPILVRVLAITGPIGQVRTIVGKGPQMETLLRQAIARGITATAGVSWEYVNKLLAEFRRATPPPPHPTLPLVEPLTEREFEVLRLIAVGLSNREVADELSLAVGTVKRHTNNIYGKLNVHSRTQAVARARELGLL